MAAGKHLLGKARSSQIVGTAKVGEKGQIVIPKEARDLLGIRPGDTLLFKGSRGMKMEEIVNEIMG